MGPGGGGGGVDVGGAPGLMGFDEASAQVVAFLKQSAPMAFWSVTRVTEGRQVYVSISDEAYGKVAGDSVPWSQSLCQYVIAGVAPQIAPDAMAVPAFAASDAAQALQIGSFVGVPIRAGDGSLFGTICGLDPQIASPDLLTRAPGLRLLADLLGRVLEAESLRAQAEERAAEIQEAQASLARSEAMYRFLVAGSRDVISRHAAGGEVRYLSPAVAELTGWTPDEVLGHTVAELLHPDDLAVVRAQIAGAVDGAGECTFRVRHRDGHWVWVESTATILREPSGEVTEVLAVSRDVTARRVREAAVEQESKLESLGRLSAGLAHEINTPIQYVGDNARFLAEALTDLMGLVGLYRQAVGGDVPADWAARLPAVHEAEARMDIDYLQEEVPSAVAQTLGGIDRVATIVRAMKAFSHPGQGDHVPADVNQALAATVTVARHQVTQVAELTLDLAELPPVRCNVAELNQVFLNLVVNAADAVGDTGRRGHVHVASSLDGDCVVVTVRDDGPGIAEHVRPHVFEPFFTTKAVGRGTGQGLPLARSVVQDGHGGTITLDTEVGAGTTVTVRLPVAGAAEPAPTARPALAAAG